MPNEIVLVNYDAACRALEIARSIDEVEKIRDAAFVLKAYAKQAKNKNLEANAFEIRVRAERKVGEMMANGRGDRAPEGRPNGHRQNPLPTLRDNGIDKGLAHRARKLAKLTDKEFKLFVIDGRANVEHAVERSAFMKPRRSPEYKGIICPKCGYEVRRG